MIGPKLPDLNVGANAPIFLGRNGGGSYTDTTTLSNANFITPRTIYIPTPHQTAVINSQYLMPLPCKFNLGTGGNIRPPAGNQMQGFIPPSGNQHNSRLGFGSFPQHPINTRLLPEASNFYGYLNSNIVKAK
jgi:hypothetical protein